MESCDAYLFAGPVFSDYSTVGFSALIQGARLVEASPERILVEGQAYHGLDLAEFLTALAEHLEATLDARTTVVAETGDSWFNGVDLRLPSGCRFEIQMQYGAIGRSVGACLGLAMADPERRILGLIEDGSFQMAAQAEVQSG